MEQLCAVVEANRPAYRRSPCCRGPPFRRLIERDDRPLSPNEEQEQAAARKKQEDERRKRQELRERETPEQRQRSD
jgi:hypothetical protein